VVKRFHVERTCIANTVILGKFTLGVLRSGRFHFQWGWCEGAAHLDPNHGELAVDMLEKVLEKLATTESTTLAVSRETGGKIRIGSLLWETPKAILPGEVLEIRSAGGSLHIARKTRHHDDWYPPVALWAGHRRNDTVIVA
jgi:hypothetical protein